VCACARSVCVECVSVAQRPFERRTVCACVPLVPSSQSFLFVKILFFSRNTASPRCAVYENVLFFCFGYKITKLPVRTPFGFERLNTCDRSAEYLVT